MAMISACMRVWYDWTATQILHGLFTRRWYVHPDNVEVDLPRNWSKSLSGASSKKMRNPFIAVAIIVSIASASQAQIVISEVYPNGSGGGAAYAADWFELTNRGAAPVNISGWSMDDDSFTPGTAPLTGVTIIQPGQSVVFLNAAATVNATFINSWFGANPPPGFTIGDYNGTGVGLSTAG